MCKMICVQVMSVMRRIFYQDGDDDGDEKGDDDDDDDDDEDDDDDDDDDDDVDDCDSEGEAQDKGLEPHANLVSSC